MSNIYDKLGQERKKMQEDGVMPEWYSTGGWQLFKERYLYQASNPREQYERIARTLSQHTPDPEKWNKDFFNLLWKGWLSPSTPVLSNTGTSRGLPVSCAGSYVSDSISDIYTAKHEVAMLTKYGFGTASYLGDIRSRGSDISVGGKAEGVLPIIQGIQKDMEYVSQGNARRGSWAGYLPIDHGDFEEVCTYLESNPDGNNIGWNVSEEFIERLNNRDEDALHRYMKALKTKMITGKGYFFFPDKANEKRPEWYKDQGLDIKSPQLCNEIMLHSSEDYTYTCVLSSMNLSKWNEWKDTNAVFVATVFLDCVVQEFIERAKNIKGLEKAVSFTKKSRALGLGVCGYHSYMQSNMIPFESVEAQLWNIEVFKHLNEESKKASAWIAQQYGEPEWMKGYGYANTHRCVTGSTPVLTREGQIPIELLVGKSIEVWNGSSWSKVEPFETGDNEIYRVEFSNGMYLDCTPDHKFLIATASRTNDGRFPNKTLEIETLQLRKGDCIPKFPVECTGSEKELPYAYTAGLFCGDGSINEAKKGKYPRNELRLYGDKMALKDNVEWKSSKTWGDNNCVRGYLPDNILQKYSVPLLYSRDSKIKWLSGLIDSDGCETRRGVSISMKYYNFARDVALLVQSLGGEISITKCSRSGGYSTDDLIHYVVNISEFSCGKIFYEGSFKPLRVKINPNSPKSSVGKGHFVEVTDVYKISDRERTYCFTESEYGTGVFGGILTKQCAVAPTKSTALIMGGVSEGINPDTAFVYTQRTPSGEVDRVNPVLLKLMKERGVYNKKEVTLIRESMGSVQGVDWLTEDEKEVFKTAFEIDQMMVIKQASRRSQEIDQYQSLNTFFAAGVDESIINEVHKEAFLDPHILGLYYIYGQAEVQASSDKDECLSCQ